MTASVRLRARTDRATSWTREIDKGTEDCTMPRLNRSWLAPLALGVSISACYAHHTVDEEVEESSTRGDGGVNCLDVADDDVDGQMACDPDLNRDAGVRASDAGVGKDSSTAGGGTTGGGTTGGGTTGGATNCNTITDAIQKLLCQVTSGGGAAAGGTTGGAGGTAGGAGGLNIADILSALSGSGIDLGTILGILGGGNTNTGGILGGNTGTTGGFLGGNTGTTGGFLGGTTGTAGGTGGFLGGLGGGTTGGATGGFLGGLGGGGTTGGGRGR
jgi:hypothetical protein